MNITKSAIAALACLAVLSGAASAKAEVSARNLLAASGVKGGLVVCVGCDDPQLLVDFGEAGPYLVQGLDTDAKKVEAARKFIQSKGLYGKVTVDVFDGKDLPYVDNLVNLLVVRDQNYTISDDEMNRVLARGRNCQCRDGSYKIHETRAG